MTWTGYTSIILFDDASIWVFWRRVVQNKSFITTGNKEEFELTRARGWDLIPTVTNLQCCYIAENFVSCTTLTQISNAAPSQLSGDMRQYQLHVHMAFRGTHEFGSGPHVGKCGSQQAPFEGLASIQVAATTNQ